jgi:hypothetical protein
VISAVSPEPERGTEGPARSTGAHYRPDHHAPQSAKPVTNARAGGRPTLSETALTKSRRPVRLPVGLLLSRARSPGLYGESADVEVEIGADGAGCAR